MNNTQLRERCQRFIDRALGQTPYLDKPQMLVLWYELGEVWRSRNVKRFVEKEREIEKKYSLLFRHLLTPTPEEMVACMEILKDLDKDLKLPPDHVSAARERWARGDYLRQFRPEKGELPLQVAYGIFLLNDKHYYPTVTPILETISTDKESFDPKMKWVEDYWSDKTMSRYIEWVMGIKDTSIGENLLVDHI